MKNNYWGFTVNYAEIGDQYPIAAGKGNENSWEGTFIGSNLQSNYSDGTQSSFVLYQPYSGWNCDPTLGACTDPNTYQFWSAPGGIGAIPIDVTESTCLSGRGMNNWKHQEMLKIAKGQNNYPVYNESAKWMSKYGLYNQLQNDTTLQSGDADLQSFTDSISQSSMGAICNLNKLLSQNNANSISNLTTAQTTNSSLFTHNIVEQNFRDVFAIIIDNRKTDSLSSNQISQLKAIAIQCPYESGPSVYNARVLLSRIDNTVYRNDCENAKPAIHKSPIEAAANGTAITVFPNPANNMLNVAIHLEQGQTAILKVYDLTGKLVLSKTLNENTDVSEISTVSLSEGMYIYKINTNGTTVNTGKLSIIR